MQENATSGAGHAEPARVTSEPFGKTPEGTQVELFTLRSRNGCEARITNYGGIVVSLHVPDRSGELADVVLGYETLEGYLKSSPYFGCIVGRYGNRIGGARFTLDGKTYTLAANDGPNSLHGGVRGFDKVVWAAKVIPGEDGPALELRYTSPDGEEGFPGTLAVRAVYSLGDDNALRLSFEAKTDKPTVCNLTHHSYFNLAGQGKGDILGHEMMIAGSHITPVDSTLIPTGELLPVAGTPFDFTRPRPIGERIDQEEEQLAFAGGYDHNWVLDKPAGALGLAARVCEPASGRVLECWTTEPGIQFYAGNFLDGTIVGKGGQVYRRRYGFCLEPQHFPNSPNQPRFPTVVLRPGQVYRSAMEYRFRTR
ncbi:MAG TPA: aldose epimerase family protein [Armatimonadota bacterium]|nr:aldose epimerase family protein [Armatimonadota bacterium]